MQSLGHDCRIKQPFGKANSVIGREMAETFTATDIKPNLASCGTR